MFKRYSNVETYKYKIPKGQPFMLTSKGLGHDLSYKKKFKIYFMQLLCLGLLI